MFGSGYDYKIQFEGIAGTYRNSYHHINRQGIIEIADKHLLDLDPKNDTIHAQPIIDRILKILPNAFQNLQELGLNGPYIILTPVLDIKDRLISYNKVGFSNAKSRQNDMIFPPFLITNPTDLSE